MFGGILLIVIKKYMQIVEDMGRDFEVTEVQNFLIGLKFAILSNFFRAMKKVFEDLIIKRSKIYFLRFIGLYGIFAFITNSAVFFLFSFLPLGIKKFSSNYPYLDSPQEVITELINNRAVCCLSLILLISYWAQTVFGFYTVKLSQNVNKRVVKVSNIIFIWIVSHLTGFEQLNFKKEIYKFLALVFDLLGNIINTYGTTPACSSYLDLKKKKTITRIMANKKQRQKHTMFECVDIKDSKRITRAVNLGLME